MIKKSPKIIQHSDADHSQMIGGNADAEHTQIIGRDAAKLLGGTYPPRVSAPMANFHFSIILFTLKVQVVPISEFFSPFQVFYSLRKLFNSRSPHSYL